MLVSLLLATLSLPYASPAKAGAQLPADRSWAPAFAGEAEKDRPSGKSVPAKPGSMTPVDAERAFAADARTIGQWTAFRKWSTDDAVMFTPQPTNAHEFLKDRKDQPRVIDWWPTASYISCDGSLAVNTGGWTRPDGAVGYFSTVWRQQKGGNWKWVVDGGDDLKTARSRPARVSSRRASCGGKPRSFAVACSDQEASEESADGTLVACYEVAKDLGRSFRTLVWTGRTYRQVIDDQIVPK